RVYGLSPFSSPVDRLAGVLGKLVAPPVVLPAHSRLDRKEVHGPQRRKIHVAAFQVRFVGVGIDASGVLGAGLAGVQSVGPAGFDCNRPGEVYGSGPDQAYRIDLAGDD